MSALLAQIQEIGKEIIKTGPVFPAIPTHQAIGTETGLDLNAPHAATEATTKATARQEDRTSFGVAGAVKTHIVIELALYFNITHLALQGTLITSKTTHPPALTTTFPQ